jgi:flavin-dependent dehydrogenase
VGDAGYFKDPITAHGITDALRDAELLADAVLEGLGHTTPAVALATYEAIRDRLSRALYEVTESVCRYDWDGPQIRTLMRRVSSAMSDEVDHLPRVSRRVSAVCETGAPGCAPVKAVRTLVACRPPRGEPAGNPGVPP